MSYLLIAVCVFSSCEPLQKEEETCFASGIHTGFLTAEGGNNWTHGDQSKLQSQRGTDTF